MGVANLKGAWRAGVRGVAIRGSPPRLSWSLIESHSTASSNLDWLQDGLQKNEAKEG